MEDTILELLERFRCLESTINNNSNKCGAYVKRSVALVKLPFEHKTIFLIDNHLSTGMGERFIKTFVRSVLTCGCEAWMPRKAKKGRLEARKCGVRGK